MKRNFWLGIFVIAVVFAVLFWQRLHHRIAISQMSFQALTQTTNYSTADTNILSKDTPNAPSADTFPSVPAKQNHGSTKVETGESREIQLQQDISSKNVPVNFYGMVVDQNNQPIPSVRIVMNVRHSEYSTSQGISSTYPKTDTQTDFSGRFSWTGETGDEISVESVTKNGYLLSPKAPHYFAASSSTYADPAIFKMWKETAKEPLIGGSHVFGIVPDGRIYTLDLISGKKLEGAADGDLQVSVVRPSGVEQTSKYQWSFMIAGIGGGLLETDDEFMYLAPESGYEPKIELQFNPNDSTWTQFVKKQFFIQTRNGKVYGRIQLQVDALYNNDSAVEINYVVNPNGSRNLQP